MLRPGWCASARAPWASHRRAAARTSPTLPSSRKPRRRMDGGLEEGFSTAADSPAAAAPDLLLIHASCWKLGCSIPARQVGERLRERGGEGGQLPEGPPRLPRWSVWAAPRRARPPSGPMRERRVAPMVAQDGFRRGWLGHGTASMLWRCCFRGVWLPILVCRSSWGLSAPPGQASKAKLSCVSGSSSNDDLTT